jgi:two-component system, sporulation sensor kinase E
MYNSIYENKTRVKTLIFVVSLFIAGGSLYYTNYIVKQLAEQEKRTIQLFANATNYVINSSTDAELSFLTQEIITANNTIPVILTDANHEPISSRNIHFKDGMTQDEIKAKMREELIEMGEQHEPIKVIFGAEPNYIYYKNSYLLTQLTYYPYVQLTIIGMFVFLGYLAFNYSRTSEQNRVWVGLAKETAHQLGTPLSSLMAWVEYFKQDEKLPQDVTSELDKDVQRLEMVTARFSNIGSVPALKNENLFHSILNTVNYLQKRISSKVKLEVVTRMNESITVQMNKPLFDWVIENLVKNAVDAMAGSGELIITILPGPKENLVCVDVADTGKGISKSSVKKVFQPGFTTRQRGWGLGLTLSKRIVENYHKGKIFIKQSEPGKGTTFRIVLNR